MTRRSRERLGALRKGLRVPPRRTLQVRLGAAGACGGLSEGSEQRGGRRPPPRTPDLQVTAAVGCQLTAGEALSRGLGAAVWAEAH